MYFNYRATDLPYVRHWLDTVTSSARLSMRHLDKGWFPTCRLPGVVLLVTFIEETSSGITNKDGDMSRQLSEAVRVASKGTCHVYVSVCLRLRVRVCVRVHVGILTHCIIREL